MKASVITKEQAIESTRNQYNFSEWKRSVLRYAQYENAVFFQSLESDNVYVIYTVDGLRYAAEISYSSSLSNAGFARVQILDFNSEITIEAVKFRFDGGVLGYAENTSHNRSEFKRMGLTVCSAYLNFK